MGLKIQNNVSFIVPFIPVRQILFNSPVGIGEITLELLLHGNSHLSRDTTIVVFNAASSFINNTKIFNSN